MSKGKREVLVIETKVLFQLINYFQGFSIRNPDLLGILENNSTWLDKEEAEKNPKFKQLVGYCAIINQDGKIFVYRRATKNEDYSEKRLQGKLSIGIGGHIEHCDSNGHKGMIASSILREIKEEVFIDGEIKEVELLGIINDDTNPVGQVHFGLFMAVRTNTSQVSPKDPEIAWGNLKSLKAIKILFKVEQNDVENWSLIGLQAFT